MEVEGARIARNGCDEEVGSATSPTTNNQRTTFHPILIVHVEWILVPLVDPGNEAISPTRTSQCQGASFLLVVDLFWPF